MASSVKGGSSIDRLSNLPDSILCHILSFLPTKYSVRTSVLSTRWRYLYTLVSNLDFEGRQSADFMNFVEKVLFFHDTTCIKRFGLILDNDLIGLGRAPLNPGSASRICGWISYALNRPLQELYLATRLKLTSSILPSSLFTSKTLVKLELIVSLALIIPTTVCFPSLKTLHFECVNFNDHDSFDRLVSGCPMLEEFVIRSSWVKCKGFLYISHSSLKKLTIGYNFVSGPTVTLPRVAVDAPSLVYLRLSCILGAAYSLANLHSLVKVDIENVADYYCSTRLPAKDSATNLVGGISNVQSLHFTNDFFWFLSSCHKPLPVYHNLVHLAISPNLKYDGCKVDLVDLLECTPKLRTLIFNKEALQNLSWVPRPKRVPSCLLSHLKAIEIHSFVGQMETAVKYFLKNGSVLEKLIIEMGMEGENSQRLPRNY